MKGKKVIKQKQGVYLTCGEQRIELSTSDLRLISDALDVLSPDTDESSDRAHLLCSMFARIVGLCGDRLMPTIRQAKQIAGDALHAQGLTFDKLTAKMVSFSDLGRESRIFVKVHGLLVSTSVPYAWEDVRAICHASGFSIE